MPLPILSVPTYANVPVAPGIPPMLRQVGFVIATAQLLIADAKFIAQTFFRQQRWGIFLRTGQPAILGETVIAVETRRDWRVADFPIEQGGFASYDKVIHPLEVRITFIQGGTLEQRTAFLQNVKAAANSLTLFDVRTPEIAYYGMVIVHYDYRREREAGATLLTVDIWLQEVRVAGPVTFTNSNTKQPDGAKIDETGAVQATPLPPRPGLA